MWYNSGMTTSDWINLIAAIIVGGGTLALAVTAFRSIRENRRIRVENRELEIKSMVLNDMKLLAIEFQELVFLSGTSANYDRTQWTRRFSKLLFEYPTLVQYSRLFSKQFQKKARSLSNCIGDYNKELISQKKPRDDEVIFIVNTDERLKMRDRVIHSVSELLRLIVKEKIKLYSI